MNELERHMVGKSMQETLSAIAERFEQIEAIAKTSTDREEILHLIAELDHLNGILKEVKAAIKEALSRHESN